MNFNNLPFIDHHCHPYDPRKAILEPESLAREFFHGMGDIPDMSAPKPRMWGTTDALLQCQELDVPVHLHSGFTGGMWQGPIHDADPFLLGPFLKHTEFLKTKIVLLHAGFPWTKQAGQMAHGFPHVWVDACGNHGALRSAANSRRSAGGDTRSNLLLS